MTSRFNSVFNLITRDLGYCCPWVFFHIFKDNQQIAIRLGVTDRAVRYNRFAAEGCTKRDCCMKDRFRI